MVRNSRPLAGLLLALLALAWGPCPGTLTRMLRGQAPESGPDRCGCGCCEQTPSPTRKGPEDKDCPYCSRHGGRPHGLPVDAAQPPPDGPVVVAVADDPIAPPLPTVTWVVPREDACGPPRGTRLDTVVLLL